MSKRKSRLSELTFNQTPTQGKVAAIYVRVSLDEFKRKKKPDAEKEYRQSVITQENEGIKEAERNKWKYKVYKEDCGESGFDEPSPTERKDLYSIEKEIEQSKIHTVIVRDQKRLTRSGKYANKFLYDFILKHNVNLIGWGEPIDIKTANGQMMFLLQSQFAQQELQYVSKRSGESKKDLLEAGQLITRAPYGYKVENEEISPIDEEIKVVRQMYTWYEQVKSMTWIVRELNRKKIPTKKSKKLWKIATVRHILTQPKYVGRMKYKIGETEDHKSIYGDFASPFPEIFEQDYWDNIQKEIKKASRVGNRAKNSPHLLVGILKCGYCEKKKEDLGDDYDETSLGYKVFPNMTYNQTKKKKGKKLYYYYVCQTNKIYGHKACDNIRLNASMIESFVEHYISSLAIDKFKTFIQGDGGNINQLKNDILTIKTDINAKELKKNRAFKTFADDWEPEDLNKALREVNRSIRTLQSDLADKETELDRLENNAPVDALTKLQKWKALKTQEKRKALKNVIPAIKVYRNRIEIYMGTPLKQRNCIDFEFNKGSKGKRVIDPFISKTITQSFLKRKSYSYFLSLEQDASKRSKLKRQSNDEAMKIIKEASALFELSKVSAIRDAIKTVGTTNKRAVIKKATELLNAKGGLKLSTDSLSKTFADLTKPTSKKPPKKIKT